MGMPVLNLHAKVLLSGTCMAHTYNSPLGSANQQAPLLQCYSSSKIMKTANFSSKMMHIDVSFYSNYNIGSSNSKIRGFKVLAGKPGGRWPALKHYMYCMHAGLA